MSEENCFVELESLDMELLGDMFFSDRKKLFFLEYVSGCELNSVKATKNGFYGWLIKKAEVGDLSVSGRIDRVRCGLVARDCVALSLVRNSCVVGCEAEYSLTERGRFYLKELKELF